MCVCSGIAKLRHTGARTLATRGCAPPLLVLLKIIAAECTAINRKSSTKSGQRFEICILRITRPRMLPWSRYMCVCRKYYRFWCSKGIVEVLQFKVTIKNMAQSSHRIDMGSCNFWGEGAPPRPTYLLLDFHTASNGKLGGTWVWGYSQRCAMLCLASAVFWLHPWWVCGACMFSCVHTQNLLSIFTTLSTAVLFSLHSGMVVQL